MAASHGVMARSYEEAFENAFEEAALTHPSWEARTSAALVAALVALLVDGSSPEEALEKAYALLVERAGGGEAQRVLAPADGYRHERGGWTVYTTRLALRALLDAEDFRSGVERVVRLAGDADTNGAVAGALLGARFGACEISRSWLDVLARRDTLLDML